ncbi:membrane protein [Sphingomonas sp. SRS2]|uniref:membrane protein n=1 Tax=Sphingomonas sp. SRS2 TaxID=133190 RepID=UPI0006184CAB|nr:membrane protein [Sphingomonas sp. SRS2]KKC23851.1 membrane protein [Sphingomonas sp. SRS2]
MSILYRVACAAVLSVSLFVSAGAAFAKKDRSHQAVDLDPDARGIVSGVGIEGQDLGRMADQMVRDLMANPEVTNRATPPRIILDSSDLRNQSSQRIDKDIITDELRGKLMNAARGKMRFVSREFIAAVEQERALKRGGVVDTGTTGLTRATAGADYKLVGKITSLDSRNNDTGMQERLTVISLEMLDLEYGTLVWNGTYKIRRAGADDVVYR